MFAVRHPERVTKLVLVSPDGFESPSGAYGQRPELPAMVKLMRYALPRALLRIRAPVLLIWGEKDAMIPLSNAADYVRELADARLVSFPVARGMTRRDDPAAAIWAPMVGAAAPRDLCTDCGISRTDDAKSCGRACQFIKPDYAALEASVHGRARDPGRPDEQVFGPFRRMVRASLTPPREGAQWTGITTRIAERLLETGAVDAVLTMAPDPQDRWRPVPVLVTKPEAMAEMRGMQMGYAPLLALLAPARAQGYKRLAVIGIPCQV